MTEKSNKLHIKPARPGLIVRDPVTLKPLPPHGATVPRESYWLRRLRDKDVVETTEQEIRAGKAKADEAAKKEAETEAKKASGAAETEKLKGGDKQ